MSSLHSTALLLRSQSRLLMQTLTLIHLRCLLMAHTITTRLGQTLKRAYHRHCSVSVSFNRLRLRAPQRATPQQRLRPSCTARAQQQQQQQHLCLSMQANELSTASQWQLAPLRAHNQVACARFTSYRRETKATRPTTFWTLPNLPQAQADPTAARHKTVDTSSRRRNPLIQL